MYTNCLIFTFNLLSCWSIYYLSFTVDEKCVLGDNVFFAIVMMSGDNDGALMTMLLFAVHGGICERWWCVITMLLGWNNR